MTRTSAFCFALLSGGVGVSAFTGTPIWPARSAATTRSACSTAKTLRRSSPLSMMSSTDEIKKMMEQAARLREEASQAEIAMGKAAPPKAAAAPAAAAAAPVQLAAVAAPAISAADLASKVAAGFAVDGAAPRRAALDALKAEGSLTKWAAATFGQAYPVSKGMLKNVAKIDGEAFSIDGGLDDLKYALGIVVAVSSILAVLSGVVIGGNVGSTFTYVFAIIPILFLGVGSTSPGLIAAAIAIIKDRVDPEYANRRIAHEAAHALVGWLAGVPVRNYKVDGATTQIEFYDTRDGDQADLNRKLTKAEIDVLSVVALAGAVAEVQKFGKATGAAADLDMLGRLMNRAQEFMPATQQEEQTRWAALTAYQVLKGHEKELAALEAAFREGKSVESCIAAVETS